MKGFLDKKFPEIDNIDKLKSNIEAVEIKNFIKSKRGNKIPRFNLKLYVFISDSLIDFPKPQFNYEAITTDDFSKMFIDLLRSKFISIILI